MNIAWLGRRACLSARQPTCFTRVAGPIIQVRGAKKRRPQTLQIKEDNEEEMTEEERVEALEKQRIYSSFNPLSSMWSVDAETLDHLIPYKTRWTSWADVKTTPLNNLENRVRNFTANWKLAMYDSFPGRTIGLQESWQRFVSWPRNCLSTTSVKPDAWLAPLRDIAAQTYQDLNQAVADKDMRQARLFAKTSYRDDVLERIKKMNRTHKYFWHTHRELAPLKILSIRAVEFHFGSEDPPFGNRLLVQALCRIETEQSLEVYDQRGMAIHTPLDPDADVRSGKRIPAQRRRVLEYLILEKKMFYDTPWYFREQMWPTPGRKVAA
ncbi:hypothetical protein CPB85DRAFT_1439561 [Mucidula mucida]|nr:hypothetical protein CPB85DRAFT_1439561 [Mucidula mucida]